MERDVARYRYTCYCAIYTIRLSSGLRKTDCLYVQETWCINVAWTMDMVKSIEFWSGSEQQMFGNTNEVSFSLTFLVALE